MKTLSGLRAFILSYSIVFCSAASACLVSEIIDMVGDKAGNVAINKACKEVDDGPQCSVSQVTQFARQDKDEEDSRSLARSCDTPSCQTPMGGCFITGSMGGRVLPGNNCVCPSPMGYVGGRVACN